MFAPLHTQILPGWVDRYDEGDFPNAQPALDSFFALNGIANVLESFKIHQAIKFVLRSKAGADPHFVLAHPANEVASDSRVKRLRAIRHDVDEINLGRSHLQLCLRREDAKFLGQRSEE